MPPLAQLQGRSVGDVLKELRSQGLIFIYNDQIVPATLRVEVEPAATHGLELAREILAPYGLTDLRGGAPRLRGGSRFDPTPGRPGRRRRRKQESAKLEEVVVQTSRYVLAADETSRPRTF